MDYSELHPQVQGQFDIMNLINILSFCVGILQLAEEENIDVRGNVKSENAKQTVFLLNEIKKIFKEQNDKLDEILYRLKNAPQNM